MRSPLTIAVVLIAALAAVGYLVSGGGGSDDADVAQNLKTRRLAEQSQTAVAKKTKTEPKKATDWRELERLGKSPAIPDELFITPNENGGSWVISPMEREEGAEIPFGIGKFPDRPPSDQDLVHENPGFLGTDACQECHQEKHDGFVHTAHYLTSRWPSKDSIAGSFQESLNVLETKTPSVAFKMVERDNKFYQRVFFFGWEFEVPMDIVIGSSKLGQSFLYWHGDRLYQNQVTYIRTADRWTNSPGYLDGDAQFARRIQARCVDCHFTYIDYREAPNHFTEKSIIMGVGCERCHGPGQKHVEYHRANKNEKVGKFVSVPSDLTREQQMDLCGQCHSTVTRLKNDNPFSFRPGDKFSDFYEAPDPENEGNSVHSSNQIARLMKSKCFQETEMACADCHNPHKQERGDTQLFSNRCMKCHQSDDCGLSGQETPGLNLQENCIDCHMQLTLTKNLRATIAGEGVFPPLRDHYIHVNEEATRSYLLRLQMEQQLQSNP